ncbi:hypothetical protein TNCT_555551 [Trichonephila clavata]|uniref:BTB domain-containing protein n=1 Tax=Trichonephila clavata TaxID=2740835 RepID=A0A8X6IAG2_TRICU|nr:hypothetical protein TNCT_612811 [Trichonephila clavata]GFR14158.1 hypothetical protein TNCT_555551 [Trichonephila clavata]
MFTNDTKKIKGSVDIGDLDADIIRRILTYMYTDNLEDILWESAFGLYETTDKYEIPPRRKSSASLEDHVSLTNVCDTLVLTDTH